MKKTILMAALMMGAANLMADDDPKYLTVAYNNIEESITLSTVQKITFEGENVVVATTDGTKTFPLAEMQKMFFSATETAIESLPIESDGLKMQDGQLIVSGKGTLRIYSANGALVGITALKGETTSVNLQNLQRGVYIVNLGEQTIKIQK